MAISSFYILATWITTWDWGSFPDYISGLTGAAVLAYAIYTSRRDKTALEEERKQAAQDRAAARLEIREASESRLRAFAQGIYFNPVEEYKNLSKNDPTAQQFYPTFEGTARVRNYGLSPIFDVAVYVKAGAVDAWSEPAGGTLDTESERRRIFISRLPALAPECSADCTWRSHLPQFRLLRSAAFASFRDIAGNYWIIDGHGQIEHYTGNSENVASHITSIAENQKLTDSDT